ncbi:hypothetical protein EGW08_005970 [Elysia chlorotica]|uniref:Olfactomedin-like domain-containing protein n=1 Tax=Elysia chlorotica TaxID=188477 RepID=A0A3S1BE61_ELYCH|nr:hypothetical protein EGW08_005970 [Elysia chlorotica]
MVEPADFNWKVARSIPNKAAVLQTRWIGICRKSSKPCLMRGRVWDLGMSQQKTTTVMAVPPNFSRKGRTYPTPTPNYPSSYARSGTLAAPLLMTFTLTLIVMSALTLTLPAAHAFSTGGEHPCTYDFELQTSTMKISCPGSPSTVNVFADTASVQAQGLTDARGFQPGGGGGGGGGGGREGFNSNSRERGYNHLESGGGDPVYPYVWNASKRLDDARRSLTGYSASLDSVSVKLAEGKINLVSDMDKLRRDTDTADQLKQHIVAAMTNQFNFMRSLVVNGNQDLQTLVQALNMLIEVTSEGLHKARDSHRVTLDRVDYLNSTMGSVRKMLTSELRKKDKRRRRENKQGKKLRPKDLCPKEISAIGAGSYMEMKYKVGAYMVQSNNPNQYRSVYVMEGSGPQDEMEAFDTPQDVAFDIPAHYIPLPYMCSGTGHAVYSGENTDVDLAVDELGLWALYATNASAGKLVITKIDHKHMELDKTWMTSYPKRSLGNAFMICGTLYATDSHRDVPTFIRYVYNTETGEEQLLDPGEMPFLNSALVGRLHVLPHAQKVAKPEATGEKARKIRAARRAKRDRRARWRNYRTNGTGNTKKPAQSSQQKPPGAKKSNSVMLSYDFRTSSLLSWNDGRLETFPIYFRDEE